MRDEAERYCAIIEQAETVDRDTFVATTAESLARLLVAAPRLGDSPPASEETVAGPSHDEWHARFAAVNAVLGEWSLYSTTLAPYGEDAGEATLMLADMLGSARTWGARTEVVLGFGSIRPTNQDSLVLRARAGAYRRTVLPRCSIRHVTRTD